MCAAGSLPVGEGMPPVSLTQRRMRGRLMPVHVDRPAELPAQVRRAAHVHPEDAVRQRRAGLVDRHGALALGAAAHGGDLGGRTVVAGEETPRRGDQGPPPVVRPLLRAAARQHEQLDGLELPGGHSPVDADRARPSRPTCRGRRRGCTWTRTRWRPWRQHSTGGAASRSPATHSHRAFRAAQGGRSRLVRPERIDRRVRVKGRAFRDPPLSAPPPDLSEPAAAVQGSQ